MGHFSEVSDFQGTQLMESPLGGACLVSDAKAWSSLQLHQTTQYGPFRACALRATSAHLLITTVHFAAWILLRI